MKHAQTIDELNKKVAELVDQIAKLTAENRELKNTNTDLHVRLQGLLRDDEF